MDLYIRNRVDGFIYGYNEILAKHPKCEVITEEEAFPERFIPKPARGRKPRVQLETPNIPEEPPIVNEDLNKDASRRGFAIAGNAGVLVNTKGAK